MVIKMLLYYFSIILILIKISLMIMLGKFNNILHIIFYIIIILDIVNIYFLNKNKKESKLTAAFLYINILTFIHLIVLYVLYIFNVF